MSKIVTYTFSNGTVADATEVNQNFTDLQKYFGVLTAEGAVRTLQSNNTFINGPNIVVDEFTDTNGSQNTVNTGSSTAIYETPSSNADTYTLSRETPASSDTQITGQSGDSFLETWSNPENVYDMNDNTLSEIAGGGNESTVYIGNEFSEKTIEDIRIKASISGSPDNANKSITLQTYDGSNWNNESVLASTSDFGGVSYNDTYSLNSSVQGVRLNLDLGEFAGGEITFTVHTFEYNYYFNNNSTVYIDSNTTSLDGNEKGFAISVPDSSFPTNTSIDVTVGDGTNTLSAETIDSTSKGVLVPNDSLSSGNLELTFTLKTSDTSVTPTLKNYGVSILR